MSRNPDVPASARALTSPDARTAPASPRLVNLPNGLTVLRLVLVPIFVAFLVEGGTGSRIVAFFVFGVASATDLLDGQLARRSGMITDFGKIADPIADKALTGSALITLSALGELPWWVTGIILVREVAVTVLRFWVIRHGVIAASRGGKIKTVLQMAAIGLYILPCRHRLGQVRPHGRGGRGDGRHRRGLRGQGAAAAPRRAERARCRAEL